MAVPASSIVRYTIKAPLDGGGFISGNFSIEYDNILLTQSLNSVNINTNIESYTDASGFNPVYDNGGGSYQLQLNGGIGQTIINYTDSDIYVNSATVDVGSGTYSMLSSDTYSNGGTMSGSLADPACFTPGTLIPAPTGSTPVQDL